MPSSSADSTSELLALLAAYAGGTPDAKRAAREQATALGRATSADALRQGLIHVAALDDETLTQAVPPLTAWLAPQWERFTAGPFIPVLEDQETLAALRRIYQQCEPEQELKGQVLRGLALAATPAALELLLELLLTDPPQRTEHADQAFVPLFRRKDQRVAALYPRLLDAVQHPQIATAVLDLANYLVRERVMTTHPGRERWQHLAELLGGVVQHLDNLERHPNQYAKTPEELSQKVGQSVGLAIALCDALGLIGEAKTVGRLRQALELSHRRIKTEAAAALARLGDDEGVEALQELAAQPASRPQAIAYLTELGLEDKIEPQFRTPAAKAEGEFAAWLASRAQIGIPPHRLQVIDRRQQFWPGFHEPVDCSLVRYEYNFPAGRITGIGIAEPLIHAFQVDLEDLPPDDIYAMYAGWSAEHASIRETPVEQLDGQSRTFMDELAGQLANMGYTHIRPIKLGQFFGQQIPVYVAKYEDKPGVAMVEGGRVHWVPAGNSSRPLGPHEAYDMLKGRKLMEAFNRES